jgi:hypothetical protein
MGLISFSVCPWKAFQPTVMFAGEARNLPIEGGATERLSGRLRLTPDIRLDWKGLPGDKHSEANTYVILSITAEFLPHLK